MLSVKLALDEFFVLMYHYKVNVDCTMQVLKNNEICVKRGFLISFVVTIQFYLSDWQPGTISTCFHVSIIE